MWNAGRHPTIENLAIIFTHSGFFQDNLKTSQKNLFCVIIYVYKIYKIFVIKKGGIIAG
uniref:Uncharacterized protein n=1 Tax=uncultured Desulfobacterium sp. TaxID=201089 RepID=E1YBQ8_9BACT|nr:unknown protein [uncultured Desulfobacterium sp.]